MIPKIIHYCWLSNDPVPEDLQRYMKTWKQHLPDYDFVKWDFSRFDINSSVWVKEAFECKKYAFAADYIRMFALYTMGGIYLDMDVEVLKSYDDLLDLDYFVCYENSSLIQPEVATLGTQKGCKWIKMILDYYKERHFIHEDGSYDMKPLPQVAKSVIFANSFKFHEIKNPHTVSPENEIGILPFDFFSPKSYMTGKVYLSSNTYSVHHFSGSWIPWEQKIERKIWQTLGMKPHRVMWHVDKWIDNFLHIGFWNSLFK